MGARDFHPRTCGALWVPVSLAPLQCSTLNVIKTDQHNIGEPFYDFTEHFSRMQLTAANYD